MSRGYLVFVIALTFMYNVFLGEETRAISLSTPMILKEFGITPTQLGFAQTVAGWVGLIGWFGTLVIADGFGRKPAFLIVLLGFTVTAPLIGLAGNFMQLTILISLGFLFPMALTFAAAFIFLFLAPETARKPLEDVVSAH